MTVTTYDTAGSGAGGCNNGNVLDAATVAPFAVVDGVNVLVTISPELTFTIANQPTACNGETAFVSAAGTPTTVDLGHLPAASSAAGGQALSITTNAAQGFSVYLRGVYATRNLRSIVHNFDDTAGTAATPLPWSGAGVEAFGYTSKDDSTGSTALNPAAGTFVAVTGSGVGDAVMSTSTAQTGTGCVSFGIATSAGTPAGAYNATIIYTAAPTY
jgi:hypothetical protein